MATLQKLNIALAPELRKRVLAAEKLTRRIEKLRAEWRAADSKLALLNAEIAALKGMLGTGVKQAEYVDLTPEQLAPLRSGVLQAREQDAVEPEGAAKG